MVVLLVVLFGLVGCRTAKRSFVVTSTMDAIDVAIGDGVCATASGACSLRAAVQESNAQVGISRVELGAAQTYVLGGAASDDGGAVGDLDVTGDVILVGGGSTVTAAGDRVLDIAAGGRVDVQDIILRGAGRAASGTWVAEGGGVVRVAGVFDSGASTLHGGHAAVGGGLLVTSGGKAMLRATTIADNVADVRGGGIGGRAGAVAIHLADVTVAGNVASNGSAIDVIDGEVQFLSSIVGERQDGDACGLGSAVVMSGGGSVVADETCALSGPGDQIGRPMLAPLALLDGALVRSPGMASAAIDVGLEGCGTTDQRRELRPVDGDGDGVPRCDAGAVEVGRLLPTVPGLGRWSHDPEAASARGGWHNIAGRNAEKSNGDRTSANGASSCSYGCSGFENREFEPDGKIFEIAGPTTPGPLRIEVYDPAFTYTGDGCEQDHLPNKTNANVIAATVASMTAADGSTLGDPGGAGGARYVETDGLGATDRQAASRLCTGDQNLGSNPSNTTYLVYGPVTPGVDPATAPVVCHVTFTGRDPNAKNYSVVPDASWSYGSTWEKETAFANMLAGPTATTPKGFEQEVIAAHYHRWYPVCTVPAAGSGSYRLVVRTNADVTSVPAPDRLGDADLRGALGSVLGTVKANTGGHNRFGLRAGYSTTDVASNPAPLVGIGAASVFVGQFPGGSPSTYVVPAARVASTDAGRAVELELWDAGDVATCCGIASPNATLEIIGPTESAPLASCEFELDQLPVAEGAAGCSIVGLAHYKTGGHLLTARVALPPDFACDDADPLGCVLSVRWTVNGSPTDTATISARIR